MEDWRMEVHEVLIFADLYWGMYNLCFRAKEASKDLKSTSVFYICTYCIIAMSVILTNWWTQ